MKIGIIGSSVVGQTMGLGLVKIGHQVMLGTRDKSKLSDWQKGAGNNALVGSTKEATSFGEAIILATAWSGTEQAIKDAGEENFKNKILIDVTNPLEFAKNGPPKMISSPGNSAGEKVSKWTPGAKVVKAFNTIGSHIMVSPDREEGQPDLFIAGDEDGKELVKQIAQSWGWKSIIDLGGLNQSYLLEALAQVWIEYGFKYNIWTHAFKLLRK